MSCIFGGLNLVRVNYLCAFLFLRVLLSLRFFRFVTFRRVLDAEMKEATRMGVTLKTKGDEKEAVNSEEELFWSKGLFGAKSLLNTVYFYNGKLFGLRASEHRNISLGNIRVFDDFIKFEENVSKTFHGGICDLKYVPRSVTHICHPKGQSHERCLVEIYRLYIGLCETFGKDISAFYFKPNPQKLGFYKTPMGINSLNKILPDLCSAVGIKKKTAHCLRVTCASRLFQSNVDEKLIRERTAHVSNALFKYEKASEDQAKRVSNILSADQSSNGSFKEEIKKKVPVNEKAEDKRVEKNFSIFEHVKFNDCEVNVFVSEKM